MQARGYLDNCLKYCCRKLSTIGYMPTKWTWTGS